MNKTKNSIEKIRKYLGEISVVVIGVAITLSASYWITSKNEERNTTLYLNSIKLELLENKNTFDEAVKQLESCVKYANYLRSHDKKSLCPDTIKAYSYTYYTSSSIIIKTNAFYMFKTSGNMRLMKDKELLLSIWDSYAKLDKLTQSFDKLIERKLEDIMKETQLISLPDNDSLSDEKILKNIPMYNFYAQVNAPRMLTQLCETGSTLMSETLSKLGDK